MIDKKVLIVEDDELISELIAWRVEALGYGVCGIAVTGEESVALAKAHNPDVVLMDITLKGQIDGIEAARMIKEINEVPVIFITGSSEEEMIDKTLPVKPAGYIIKPFTDKDLRVALKLAFH
jgi:CheY-like chemotaxis protein